MYNTDSLDTLRAPMPSVTPVCFAAMYTGVHEIDDGLGSHGLQMPEDLNIVHYFKARSVQR